MILQGPRKFECKQCGWSFVIASTSDVITGPLGPSKCANCGCVDFNIKDASFLESFNPVLILRGMRK